MQRPDAEDLPEEVHEAFNELDGAKTVPRMAAMGCRRILELACKGKLDKPKATLAERIGQLQGQGLITKDVAEWAKQIKNCLNQSTHDGSAPSKEEAEELMRFTLFFIELLYVYPSRAKRLGYKPSSP
jgi:hypothetical protein